MKRYTTYLLGLIVIIVSLSGCSNIEQLSQSSKITYTSFANDVNFTLEHPADESLAVNTTVQLIGEMENYSYLETPHLWVVAVHEASDEPFNYYIQLSDGKFSEDIQLPFGPGEYNIAIRAQSNEATNSDLYYDLVTFNLHNNDEHIEQVVEYTKYGMKNNLIVNQTSDSDRSITIEGSIADNYPDDKILVEVTKDSETEQLIFPLSGNEFQGEVPLYFGEGTHDIHIQLFNEEDEYYYTSALIQANSEATEQFTTIETFADYYSRGINLQQPANSEPFIQTDEKYTIKGSIDPDKNKDSTIEHIIITMNYKDEDIESGYIIPVENNKFEDDVYFRFGSGTYEIKINIPDDEQTDQSMFYYRTVATIDHEVKDVTDQRNILPSRGIQSDHPTIIEQAEKITEGIHSEREQAKAIYDYVTQTISYDVKKAEADLFEIDDSALSTLETRSGICQDYTFLATALLRAIDLEAHYVSGYAGDRHAWVEVKVDGEWIEMDPTWGAGYVQNGEFHFHYNEDYFDPDPNFLAETHTREDIMY